MKSSVNRITALMGAGVVLASLLACSHKGPARDCHTDADCGNSQTCEAGECQIGLGMSFLSPTAGTATNGTLQIQLELSSGAPNEIELWVDELFVKKIGPPYRFDWDTRGMPEGEHKLWARAASGSRTYDSAPVSIIVDRSTPTVVDRTPAPGARNVWSRDPITVTFSDRMASDSITQASVGLDAGGSTPLAKLIRWSNDRKTLTIEPAALPEVPNTLEVTLPANLTDEAGNAVVLPGDGWIWSVPDWQDVEQLKCENCGGLNELTAGAGGTLAAKTVRSTGSGSFETWVSIASWSGNAWQVLFSHLPPRASEISVDIGGEGLPAVVWVENPASGAHVRAAKWDGSGWSDEVNLDERSEWPQWPIIRIDNAGNPVVAWMALPKVFVRHWDGSQWRKLGTDGLDAVPSWGSLDISFGPKGRPQVIWSTWTGSGFTLESALWSGSSWDRSSFAVPNAFMSQPSGLERRRFAFDPTSGMPVMAWVDTSASPSKLMVSTWDDYREWKPLGQPLNVNVARDAFNPQIAFGPEGTLNVAWQEAGKEFERPGAGDTYVKRWNGATWTNLGGRVSPGRPCDFVDRPLAVARAANYVAIACEGWGSTFVKRYNR